MNTRVAIGASRPCRPSPNILFLFSTPSTTHSGRTTLLRPATVRNPDSAEVQQASAEIPSDETLLSELEKREGFRRRRALRKISLEKARKTYQLVACGASMFIVELAAAAIWFRFSLTKPKGSPFPWLECAGTLILAGFGMACMEMYARWAHKVWWHDLPGGWALHKSHHAPRKGPFEANDIYAVANAIPAFALCFIGFIRTGWVGSMIFGLGLGITLFGMAYMFVHDGLVHKRFPVGPLANVPFMKRVAAAHMLHHADKYDGKPYGMFLGPQEIAHIPEAVEEMERLASIL